ASIGGKFGVDEDLSRSDAVTTHIQASSWVRTSLSLSAAQVVKMYELQFVDGTPEPIVGISLPTNPEAMATPSELAAFCETYKKYHTSDYNSLPRTPLTSLLLTRDRRSHNIEFTNLYSIYLPYVDKNRGELAT